MGANSSSRVHHGLHDRIVQYLGDADRALARQDVSSDCLGTSGSRFVFGSGRRAGSEVFRFVGRWISGVNPVRAVLVVAQPIPNGAVGSWMMTLACSIFMLSLAALCFSVSTWRLRVWNPSREARPTTEELPIEGKDVSDQSLPQEGDEDGRHGSRAASGITRFCGVKSELRPMEGRS